MGKIFTRTEILDRLNENVKRGTHILVGGAGTGLVAKCAELGGIDVILAVSTGVTRHRGLPSITTLEDCNRLVIGMLPDLFAATNDTPIICSIEASDLPKDEDINHLIDRFMEHPFSGVMNFPSAGETGNADFVKVAQLDKEGREEYYRLLNKGQDELFESCRKKEAMGVGYSREVELIAACHSRDIFTMCYCFSPEQAEDMAKAGVDCLAGHCGGTAGGLVGHKTLSYQEAARRLQDMYDAARAVRPEVILLGHGGPFATPEDARELYKLTSANGFVAGSAIDRIPIEKAVIEAAREFKK